MRLNRGRASVLLLGATMVATALGVAGCGGQAAADAPTVTYYYVPG